MLRIFENPSIQEFDALMRRKGEYLQSDMQQVRRIMDAVKCEGDKALRRFSLEFDGVEPDSLRISDRIIRNSENQVPDKLRKAMLLAAENIEVFHRAQVENTHHVETMNGVRCWRKPVAVERVGLYIPGGSAPLFSTLLMLGIPARIAGCREVVLCTPPDKKGQIHPAILFAAKMTGVHQVFVLGGAQAIAAMCYGTETVPRVDKIFGPGNAWVTTAKLLATSEGVAIDLPAGPSELAILADDTANPDYMAADLLSQAEHGPDSQVLLVTDSDNFIEKLLVALEAQAMQLPRKEIVKKALSNSLLVKVNDTQSGMELINRYAPEHLIISSRNQNELAEIVINAGSVFIGNYSPESAGDYASGTNHTLPTSGYARAYSGVSLDSFVKKITFQELSKTGLIEIGHAVETMAEAEGLHAHKNAISIRLKDLVKKHE